MTHTAEYDACECGAETRCERPPHVELPPGDYVVASSKVAAVEAEIDFNLRHPSRRPIPPEEGQRS